MPYQNDEEAFRDYRDGREGKPDQVAGIDDGIIKRGYPGYRGIAGHPRPSGDNGGTNCREVGAKGDFRGYIRGSTSLPHREYDRVQDEARGITQQEFVGGVDRRGIDTGSQKSLFLYLRGEPRIGLRFGITHRLGDRMMTKGGQKAQDA